MGNSVNVRIVKTAKLPSDCFIVLILVYIACDIGYTIYIFDNIFNNIFIICFIMLYWW